MKSLDIASAGQRVPPASGVPWAFSWRRAAVPLALCLVLIAVFWGAHLRYMPLGGINHYDEFHTLDRSSAFARMHDWWTVYSGNTPTNKKPPLQYWMSGYLLGQPVDLEVAMRLPSMLFALGCFLATMLLVAALAPQFPWAMPAAVVLLSSSDQFWMLATSAMLDTGATFFATLSLALAIIALRRPGWWYAVAVSIAVGAFQKAAIGLVLVAGFLLLLSLTRRWHGVTLRGLWRDRRFRRSVAIAVAGVLAWPAFQELRHGDGAFDVLYEQTVERFVPTGAEDTSRGLPEFLGLVIAGEWVLRGLGILALCWLPWRLGRADLVAFSLLYGIFLVGMALAAGDVYARYSLIFMPMLAAALAVMLASFGQVLLLGLATAGIALAAGGPIKPEAVLRLEQEPALRADIAVLEQVAPTVQPGETIVTCNWNRESRFYPGAVAYYLTHGQPMIRLSSAARWKKKFATTTTGPLRGLCTPEELAELGQYLPGAVVVETIGDHVLWTRPALQ